MVNKEIPILVTGALGFVGKNLTAQLKNRGYENVMTFDVENTNEEFSQYVEKAQFIFHLAGVNRPKETVEFYTGNRDLTSHLVEIIEEKGGKTPVLLTSSAQAALDNDYGKSKREAENIIFNYAQKTGAKAFVYRMPGVFGKWCRPSYNSVVATFCHNIANGLPIEIRDENYAVPLVYIDDVVSNFINAMENGSAVQCDENNICELNCEVYTVTLGKLAKLINSFKDSRKDFYVPDMGDAFAKKLYATYLSYLPENEFSYPLVMNCDERGSFTEMLKTNDRGQVSVNISKPGIVKGNHWHNTKNEKFIVVKGIGIIRFRKIGTKEIIEYRVSDKKLEVVDIPTGYTHNIENLGTEDMVTVMWANETLDKENPDTYFEIV